MTIKPEDTITFYHISRDIDSNKLYHLMKNGIEPAKGEGVGGQEPGFYVWTDKKAAERFLMGLVLEDDVEHFNKEENKDIRLQRGKALLLEYSTTANNITIENGWQIDNEQHPNDEFGRERSLFLDFWEHHKDLFNNDVNINISPKKGESSTITHLSWDKEKNIPIVETKDSTGQLKSYLVEDTKASTSFMTQAINNYLCESSDIYRNNYNKLMQGIVNNNQTTTVDDKDFATKNIALKYCGNEALKIKEASLLRTSVVHNRFNGQRGEPLEGGTEITRRREGKDSIISYTQTSLTSNNLTNRIAKLKTHFANPPIQEAENIKQARKSIISNEALAKIKYQGKSDSK